MPGNEFASMLGRNGPSYKDASRMILDVLKERMKNTFRRSIDKYCEPVFLTLIEEASKRALNNVRTFTYEFMKHSSVNVFITSNAGAFIDKKQTSLPRLKNALKNFSPTSASLQHPQ